MRKSGGEVRGACPSNRRKLDGALVCAVWGRRPRGFPGTCAWGVGAGAGPGAGRRSSGRLAWGTERFANGRRRDVPWA